MNPWRPNILDLFRKFIRFVLWLAIATNLAMLAVFSIVFMFKFLVHLWSWCDRVLFPGNW